MGGLLRIAVSRASERAGGEVGFEARGRLSRGVCWSSL